MPYREKRIYSGNMLEVEIYPISHKERNLPRKKKEKESSYKQKNLNDKNAKKKLIRLINTNFTDNDLIGHLTYDKVHLPKTPDEAYKNLVNYMKRIKRYRKKHGLSDLKYIAVTEYHEANPKDKRTRVRIHHHIAMSGMNREMAEQIWGKGARTNCRKLSADEFGYEGFARYITKDPQGAKRWTQSKNLKKPLVKINDYKFSKKKTQQLAMYLEDRELFEKLYPGYTYTECKSYINDVTAGTQIYIKMRKKAEPIMAARDKDKERRGN